MKDGDEIVATRNPGELDAAAYANATALELTSVTWEPDCASIDAATGAKRLTHTIFRGVTFVGRSSVGPSDADRMISINHVSVSRIHGKIQWTEGDGWTFMPYPSTNKSYTYVNQQRVDVEPPGRLAINSTAPIFVGSVSIVFSLPIAADPSELQSPAMQRALRHCTVEADAAPHAEKRALSRMTDARFTRRIDYAFKSPAQTLALIPVGVLLFVLHHLTRHAVLALTQTSREFYNRVTSLISDERTNRAAGFARRLCVPAKLEGGMVAAAEQLTRLDRRFGFGSKPALPWALRLVVHVPACASALWCAGHIRAHARTHSQATCCTHAHARPLTRTHTHAL